MYYFIFLFVIIFFTVAVPAFSAEIIYVDVKKGNDINGGNQNMPLKTIQKAVEVAASLGGTEAVTIKISPGVYAFDKPCMVNSVRAFSEAHRLSIEAAILPDDPEWKPEDMPVIITTQNAPDPDGKAYTEIWSLDVEINHVTVRGLKFLGSPVPKVLYYSIYRGGTDLNDLVVSQCMFLCDKQILSSNVAVIANGNGLKIDHCVFYNCSNAAVFWNAEGGISKNNLMTNCLIYGGYVSGVWLCQTGDDFEFRDNIITNCLYSIMRDKNNKTTYSIKNCIITNNNYFSGKCDDNFQLSESGADMPYIEKDVLKAGEIFIDDSKGLDIFIPRRHLHVKEGSNGYNLMAGLFTK